MLYSIIIPAYNSQKTVASTVQSLIRSGLTDYEIILVDDGSKDQTADVCFRLASANENIHFFQKENGGVSSARNFGIEKATGEYLLFFDADDYVEPDSCLEINTIIQTTHPDMLIFGMCFEYYFHKKLYRQDNLVSRQVGLFSRDEWKQNLNDLFDTNSISSACNKLIRKEIITANSIKFHTDMIIMEDFMFSMELLFHCNEIYIWDEPIYHYKQAEDEQNAHRRLRKIGNIAEYMKHFAPLNALWKNEKITIDYMLERTYLNFFHEVTRYSSPAVIEKYCKELLDSKYADLLKKENPDLFNLALNGKYNRIFYKYLLSRFRHWIAVRVKYTRTLISRA